MHGTVIIVPVMHQQRSGSRLSPSGDTEDIERTERTERTEDIEDIVLRLAPRLAYFAGVAANGRRARRQAPAPARGH